MAVRKLLSTLGAPLCAVVLALGPAACGNDSSESGSHSGSDGHAHEATKDQFDRGQATTTLEIQALDYAWGGIPATVKGPNVVFNVRNTGSAEHELEVIGADGEPAGIIPPFKRNQSKSTALKLAPGQYTARCRVSEGAKTHDQLGMKQAFTVE